MRIESRTTGGGGQKMSITKVLPAECISRILSFTSPADACRSSLVSHDFQSAADSDAVWDTFLPSDYLKLISTSALASSQSQLSSLSKKQLFFHLCHNPILINDGSMSFYLEKQSCKKCFMIGARGLVIVWGDTTEYWEWKPLRESRFSEVAELNLVWWFDVKGQIESKILSTKTTYAAYLVFKFSNFKHGFNQRHVELGVNFEGAEVKHDVFLDPPRDSPHLARERGDGWMEIEMGEFFNENGDGGNVVCSLFEFDNHIWKAGLIIDGIEFRPKDGR